MNNTIKNALIFAVGVATGAFAAVKLTKNKYEEMVQEEISSVREMAARKREASGRVEAKMNIADERACDDSDKKVVDISKRQYNKLVKNYNGEPCKDPRGEIENPVNRRNKRDANYPYVIDIQQFSEERDDFDKITIYYYEEDDTLADADESIMPDIDGTVGEALYEFDDDLNTVYVRNERLRIDYEVIRLCKSYKETVLGYTDQGGSDSGEE